MLPCGRVFSHWPGVCSAFRSRNGTARAGGRTATFPIRWYTGTAARQPTSRSNRIDTVWRGEALRLVQLGTVMTAPAHRGKGLARSLMEAVLDDWGRTCDGVYLYANGTVLEFYPKFGFVPAREHV